MKFIDCTWLIGGPQGSGVETAASIFSRVCAAAGYNIFGKREYYSNIKGEHSYYEVRFSNNKIHSGVSYITLMIGFDAETIIKHTDDVINNGVIIYDTSTLNANISEINTLGSFFNNTPKKHPASTNKKFSIQNILETAQDRHVLLYPVRFNDLVVDSLKKVDYEIQNTFRLFTIIGVSLSLGYMRIPLNILLESISHIFSKKLSIVKYNKKISKYAYEYAVSNFKISSKFVNTNKKVNNILIRGYESIALGKILAGCRFQSYYPISPATDECEYLESNKFLNKNKSGAIVVIQSEDEISAICMAIGSSLTGTRSSTSTSGPGFSLMVESLGWAGINEIPIVITLYQRGGPSTGLPTRSGQEDLLFVINAGHGEFPRIVYASGDVEESFYDVGHCFNFAEIYQVPVIHMVDKFIASSIITCNNFNIDKIKIDRGKLLEKIEGGTYKRFAITDDGISPRSKLGIRNGIFWNTGDERDEYGHITEDPIYRIKMTNKRISRLNYILKTMPTSKQAISYAVHKYCIISWGSTKGPIIDAIEMLKKKNIFIGFIQIKLLHPFPTKYIESLVKDVKVIIDIEANKTHQLGNLFKQNLRREINYYILKYTGRPITCNEIYDSIKNILENKAKKEMILTYGK